MGDILKLNLSILLDCLKEYKPVLHTSENIDLTISDYSLLPDRDKKVQSDMLYIVDEIAYDLPEKGYYLLLNKKDILQKNSKKYNYILLEEAPDVNQLCWKLKEIFMKYQHWDSALKDAILENAEIDKIMQIGCQVFSNSIGLADTRGVFLVQAGDLEIAKKTDIWEDYLEYGKIRIEKYVNDRVRNAEAWMDRNHQPCVLTLHGNRYMIGKIYQNSAAVARIGMQEIENLPFSEGQRSLFAHLIRILEEVPLFRININVYDEEDALIWKILRGETISGKMLHYLMHICKWNEDELFCVVMIQHGSWVESERLNICNRIRQCLPQQMVLVDKENVVIILHAFKQEDIGQYLKKLKEIFESNPYSCVVSVPVYGVEQLKYAYYQCRETLGKSRVEDEMVILKTDLIKLLVADMNNQKQDWLYCHPVVRKLYSIDEKQGSNLVGTLYEYLSNGCNQLETARNLYIHRNTLSYRLNKIRDIIQCNPHELDADMRFVYLLSCILLKKR